MVALLKDLSITTTLDAMTCECLRRFYDFENNLERLSCFGGLDP